MKKAFIKFSVILLTLIIFVLQCGCLDQEINSEISTNVTSENSIKDYSENTLDVSSENSFEESEFDENYEVSEEISEAPIELRTSFLACPDNIIHPSVFYDALERAARDSGKEPDYSDLHNTEYNFTEIYKNVEDIISNADIAYINQETLTGGAGGKIIGYPCFNSPMAVADTVIDLGFDVINVAHNHMLDSRDTEYLEHCSEYFISKGADVIGYYPNAESSQNITVINKNGIKIAFLAYTYGTNGLRISTDSEFIIPYFSEDLIKEQVKIAKEISDFIIVSCHWGYENTYKANDEQKSYARLMNELGVDLVLGMHPHVIQPMEWMINENGNRTLVVYSLGNFVSGMVSGSNMLAGMLSMEIVKNIETNEVYIESPVFLPIVTHYVKKSRVASNDTGYRDFEIYHLSDYTEELASTHGVVRYEKSHSTTLVGGKFSKETLLNTLYKYIPLEFLPEEYHINVQ
ncbi:MAG: CapA family protein [Clostridia bacterium]|nr:CapA family protein [Clostridia bacterium]